VRSPRPARILEPPQLALDGQWDENEQREALKPSEKVELGRAREARLGDRRGGDHGNQHTGGKVQNFAPCQPKGKTRDIAAEAAGFRNHTTYEQAKAVVDACDPQLTAMMDRGRISPAREMAEPMLARREMRKQKGLAGWEDGKAQFIGS
jgi:hypothetical protein